MYTYISCTYSWRETPTVQGYCILLFSSLNVLKCAYSIIQQYRTFNKYSMMYINPFGFKSTNVTEEKKVPSTGSTATALHMLPCRTLFVVCLTFSFRPFRARKVSVAASTGLVRKRGGWVQKMRERPQGSIWGVHCRFVDFVFELPTDLCSQNQAIVCNISGKKKTWVAGVGWVLGWIGLELDKAPQSSAKDFVHMAN